MECQKVRESLEIAFDEGQPVEGPLSDHLVHCPHCASFAEELADIDRILRTPGAVPEDPALVARINARIAEEAPRRIPAWISMVAAALIVALALAGQWLPWAPDLENLELPAWSMAAEWGTFRSDVAALPGLLHQDFADARAALLRYRVLASEWSANVAIGGHILVWFAFGVSAAAALVLNTMEWKSWRNTRHR